MALVALYPGQFSLQGARVLRLMHKQVHPGGAMGYKFSSKTGNIVIILDNEFISEQEADLISFCKNADLLVWDAMFTDKELAFRRGWGHSSVEQAENFSKKANIKRTILSHHSPHRSDREIDFLSEKLGSSQISFGYEKMKANEKMKRNYQIFEIG